MLKETLRQMDIAAFSTAGLILFFAVFVFVTLFAVTRSRGQVERWSRVPLTDERDGHGTDDETSSNDCER